MAFGTDIRIWRKKGENFKKLVDFVEDSFEQLNEDFLITYEVTTFTEPFFVVGNNVVGSLFLETCEEVKTKKLWAGLPHTRQGCM